MLRKREIRNGFRGTASLWSSLEVRVNFVPVRRKLGKEWKIIDVCRPESLWCQTGVIFIIRQKLLLFGGYV